MPTVSPSVVPQTLLAFNQQILPRIHRAVDPAGLLRLVEAIVRTDRWNNFDEFHRTTDTLVRAFERGGSRAEVYAVPTGGALGTGRWVIQEAADVREAVLDVVGPVRLRLADFRECPWHVIQWTAGTPAEGMVGELVAIDSAEQLNVLPAGALRGKIVLTKLLPRDFGSGRDFGPLLARHGAYGIIHQSNVRNCPDAVAWVKFGWGGVPVQYGPVRLVGMVLSANQGEALRQLMNQHGKLQVRMKVDVRRYAGTHDVISGVIEGREDPQSEIWAVAHTAEPGALDNAAGVASCVESARVINHLIAEGQLPRPRRTIRLVGSYECYGFFDYLEHARRGPPPLAGLCIDGPGATPEDCERHLRWHGTVSPSAGFVDQVGPEIVRAALAIDNPGYVLETRPFVSTEDTLLGDPQFGFPCPWLTSHPCTGYHSSADDLSRVSPRGLATITAAAAAYLYYLADAGPAETLELAEWETHQALQELGAAGCTRGQAEFIRQRQEISLRRLERFWSESQRREARGQLEGCLGRVTQTAGGVTLSAAVAVAPMKEPTAASADSDFTPDPVTLRRIPLRKVCLTPTPENVFPPVCKGLRGAKWPVFWADGRRSVRDICELLAVDPSVTQPVQPEAIAAYFRALAELGYVELRDPVGAVGAAK